MQFEKIGERSHPYMVTFEGDEIEVAKAVFREEMFHHAKKGNVGSISDYDVRMADWDVLSETLPTKIINAIDFAQKFEDFYDATDDAIVEIALESGTPPFLNDEIVLRRTMGKQALELASKIKQEVAKQTGLGEVDISQIDIDAGISSLLNGERSTEEDSDEA
ncbi:hypothetical protein HY379_00440 [Candidatus Saccharibacteria bacterium]|nr:hypothetical protein [Candidatus Saccharibacteria bacterium]